MIFVSLDFYFFVLRFLIGREEGRGEFERMGFGRIKVRRRGFGKRVNGNFVGGMGFVVFRYFIFDEFVFSGSSWNERVCGMRNEVFWLLGVRSVCR